MTSFPGGGSAMARELKASEIKQATNAKIGNRIKTHTMSGFVRAAGRRKTTKSRRTRGQTGSICTLPRILLRGLRAFVVYHFASLVRQIPPVADAIGRGGIITVVLSRCSTAALRAVRDHAGRNQRGVRGTRRYDRPADVSGRDRQE